MTVPKLPEADISSWTAFAFAMIGSFVNPALIGLIWTQGSMDDLTAYPPSYVQFLVVSILAMWLRQKVYTANSMPTRVEMVSQLLGRMFTIAGFYGILVVIT